MVLSHGEQHNVESRFFLGHIELGQCRKCNHSLKPTQNFHLFIFVGQAVSNRYAWQRSALSECFSSLKRHEHFSGKDHSTDNSRRTCSWRGVSRRCPRCRSSERVRSALHHLLTSHLSPLPLPVPPMHPSCDDSDLMKGTCVRLRRTTGLASHSTT